MCPRLILRSGIVDLVLVAFLVFTPSIYAERQRADWWQAQQDANVMLRREGVSIAALSAELAASAPASAQDAMLKLAVLLRAGRNEEAIEALRELKAAAPQLENHQVASIYYYACDTLREWDVAKMTLEVFANNVSELALWNRLLEHLLESGWTVEDVDRWLAEMPGGIDNFWVKERLNFALAKGQADALLKELADAVRGNPADTGGAIAFLDVLVYARHAKKGEWDLSWMGAITKPALATQAERLASRLRILENWATAAGFYLQAADMPLTEAECRELGSMCQIMVPPERLRAGFAASVREGLADCLLRLGRNDEAQAWMVKAADIRKEHGLGLNALFAGHVQAASGQRTIEGRIQQEQVESEDDPRYWRERARYYRGRNEPAQEEQALLRGLALTRPEPEPQHPSKAHMDWRSWMLADYVGFLARQKRTDEAVALLRKEMEQAPAASESSARAANLLAFDFEKQVTADDEVLWHWLEGRPKWEHTEERLLWRMLEKADRSDLDRHFTRAERLAFENHVSRASALGWIMNRMDFAARSIPLLRYAVDNADDQKLTESARFTLFESYLDTEDWKNAEQVFSAAGDRLTYTELPEWYARIAVLAARAGAKGDAMRMWRQIANLSPVYLDCLPDLARAGLRDELREFYQEMRKAMPSSVVPARALRILGE